MYHVGWKNGGLCLDTCTEWHGQSIFSFKAPRQPAICSHMLSLNASTTSRSMSPPNRIGQTASTSHHDLRTSCPAHDKSAARRAFMSSRKIVLPMAAYASRPRISAIFPCQLTTWAGRSPTISRCNYLITNISAKPFPPQFGHTEVPCTSRHYHAGIV